MQAMPCAEFFAPAPFAFAELMQRHADSVAVFAVENPCNKKSSAGIVISTAVRSTNARHDSAIIDYLKTHPRSTLSKIQKATGLDHQSAQNRMKYLTRDKRVLNLAKIGKTGIYQLPATEHLFMDTEQR